MHRSSSVSRASGESLVDISAIALAFPSLKMGDSHALPIHHHSLSDVTKKEFTLHAKPFAHKAIHLIPLVLLFCALILWIFSHH
uniref:Uncharacterized protein n=1 Tax=Cajanus cajan TaxID=3821 RepID=A0A151S8N2_CAJCA|nr:hypothetical protein KK1_027059 [Cajanus cajan]